MRTVFALCFVSSIASGCHLTQYARDGIPTSQVKMSLSPFAGPKPDSNQETLKWIQRHARDPQSVLVRWISTARPGYIIGPFWDRVKEPGWIWSACVNWKNAYGGYTGNQILYFHTRLDKVLEVWQYNNHYPVAEFAPLSSRAEQILTGGGSLR